MSVFFLHRHSPISANFVLNIRNILAIRPIYFRRCLTYANIFFCTVAFYGKKPNTKIIRCQGYPPNMFVQMWFVSIYASFSVCPLFYWLFFGVRARNRDDHPTLKCLPSRIRIIFRPRHNPRVELCRGVVLRFVFWDLGYVISGVLNRRILDCHLLVDLVILLLYAVANHFYWGLEAFKIFGGGSIIYVNIQGRVINSPPPLLKIEINSSSCVLHWVKKIY